MGVETGRSGADLTHVDGAGRARMVDVGEKDVGRREARAGARVWMRPETMDLLVRQALPKGDVLAVARVAGILAAKRTGETIPLCHPLALDHVDVSFRVRAEESRVDIECAARVSARTGVEMEALSGVSAAALTVYDMCKAVDRTLVIGDLRLLGKFGGRNDYRWSGDPYVLEEAGRRENRATVVSVNVSPGKGERKKPADRVVLRAEHGIEGDGHAGDWHRQVSLLPVESIRSMVEKGLDVSPGDFAENITTEGLDLCSLPVGTRMTVGPTVMEITQIGKVCHDRCAIYYQAGDCVMPREGIFTRVIEGGEVFPGDEVRLVDLEVME